MNLLSVKQPSAPQSLWQILHDSGQVFESSIKGVSMAPTMPEGARVRIQPLPAAAYRMGQVVVCELDDILFAHRIVRCTSSGRRSDFVMTQGDGHILCDPPTRKISILGVITEYRAGGDWHVPGPSRMRRPGIQAISALHQSVIWLCLYVHYEFARRVAGTSLILAGCLRRVVRIIQRN